MFFAFTLWSMMQIACCTVPLLDLNWIPNYQGIQSTPARALTCTQGMSVVTSLTKSVENIRYQNKLAWIELDHTGVTKQLWTLWKGGRWNEEKKNKVWRTKSMQIHIRVSCLDWGYQRMWVSIKRKTTPKRWQAYCEDTLEYACTQRTTWHACQAMGTDAISSMQRNRNEPEQ